jgi:phage major head subunit gpT-like protein
VIVNTRNLLNLTTAVTTVFNGAFAGYTPRWSTIAMYVPAAGVLSLDYAWLRQLKKMREWIGDRQIDALATSGYRIENKSYENTLGIPRPNIETDQYGVFTPLFAELGQTAAENPDDNLYGLLNAGFETECHDGQNFFDTEHSRLDAGGAKRTWSNFLGGDGAPWFLMCTKKQLKPVIFQERIKPRLVALDDPTNPHVFMKNEFVHGVDCSQGFGYGLPQLIIASRKPLTSANYAEARKALSTLLGDRDRPLGLMGDTLLVPGNYEEQGLRIVNSKAEAGGGDNPWAGTAKLIVEPLLAQA